MLCMDAYHVIYVSVNSYNATKSQRGILLTLDTTYKINIKL